MRFSKEKVEKVVKSKGYVWFEDRNNKGYDVNIVGIRNMSNNVTNLFDDYITLSYKVDGVWKFHQFEATTEPGKYWMNNPENKFGTAILKPGQYRGSHMLGLHAGKYEALRQRTNLPVYRDNDRDDEYDLIPESIQEGYFGINIHRSNPYTESYLVNKWSAGCQVFKKVDDFNLFMNVCRKASKIWGNKFTYTLLDLEDFKD